MADREKIVQVLENLLTNAVKFTPLGGTINVICNTLNGSKGKKIEVCVRDSGMGIPKGMKEKIFERFFQVGPQSKHKGLGLGLSIVKSILEAHNEGITVDSEKGKGSNFCFTLPVYGGNNK
jgi:signal transduction histidine kinase